MSREKTVWSTALTDVSTTGLGEGLGQIRVETAPVLGERMFRWMRNGSGGSLAVNSLVGHEAISEATITAAVNTDVTKVVRASGSWTIGELSGYYCRVLDDAGAAGAAPEGEIQRIATNSANTITLATGFTAAVTTSDTFQVHRPFHMIASADGMVKSEVAGVLMATVANGSWGWVQFRGFHPSALVVAAGTTLAAGSGLKAGAGILVVAADAADNGEIVAQCPLQVTTDTVLRTCPVYLDCSFG